ncbi:MULTISPECIES: glycosyltransferase family 2 protein [unclassified Aeromonas]|uniref:glycosyltransferase family 2 protein n=1 Tax=unclassified Aeromonas TaxID=257493 RepID=UPI003BA259C8
MHEWMNTVHYILIEILGSLQFSPRMILLLLPMLLLMEVPLMALTLTGILKWYARQLPMASELPRSRRCPKVSCIITCYGEGEAIRSTILTLKEQLYRGQMEIIAVIDGAKANAHTYQAALNCVREFEGCENRSLVLLPKWQRGGRVSTLNAGLSAATGEIVMNADGDTSFDNNMIDEIVACFDDPDVPAVGGALRVRNLNDGVLTRMQSIEYMISMQGGKTGLSEWNLINNISGAFGAFRRDFLRQIGGWDTHTAEDLDLTVRIKHYLKRHPALKIGFAPRAIGHTDAPADVITLAKQRLRWDGDLLFLYLRKHKLSLTPRILGWKTFLFTLIYGVAQNVVLPLLVMGYSWWLVLSYPGQFVAALMICLYLVYLFLTLVNFAVFLLAISERPKADLRLLPWLCLYPVYTLLMRLWCAIALLNEMFRRGHEESSMAPWWVLKRGNKF